MKDGRTMRMRQISDANRRRVKRYLEAYPQTTIKEACEALNMSRVTFRRHAEALGLYK